MTGKKTVVPLDELLKIDYLPFKITKEMMLEISYWAIKLKSYEETSKYFLRDKNIKISSDTIRLVTNYIGKLVFDSDVEKAKNAEKIFNLGQIKVEKILEGTLYLMIDGATFNTRTKNSDGSTWRENKLCVAFSNRDIKIWKDKHGKICHKILKKEYICYVGSYKDFQYHVFSLALSYGYMNYKKVVIISDGATWIRNIKNYLFPDAQQILDLYHLKENVYKFAKEIYKSSEKDQKSWAEKICNLLENGKWKDVLAILEEYKYKKSTKGSVNLYNYIINNKDNIDYPSYRAEGLFVGSGAVESGNKIVLQNRLKLSGMRWNAETAQYIISLKAKLESDLWELSVEKLVRKGFYNDI